jgi:pyruvate dehydrogenase E1 component
VPFYTFYSMFGFQRVGDQIWSAADSRARGFLMGATAGRTTLMGEGLQHQDGHSLLLASTVPVCQAYDPAFSFEMATIIEQGIHRMYGPDDAAAAAWPGGRDVFFYLAIYNENAVMPAMPDDPALVEQIMRGLYQWTPAPQGPSKKATLIFSGSAHLAVRAAAEELAERWDVACDVWSATSYKALRDDALSTERWNRMHPGEAPRTAYVTDRLSGGEGPIIATTDFMKIVPEQVARFVGGRSFVPLGTDGFGRSDTRESLRRHFEIDAPHVVVATLSALAAQGEVKQEVVADAIAAHGLDPEAIDPLHA